MKKTLLKLLVASFVMTSVVACNNPTSSTGSTNPIENRKEGVVETWKFTSPDGDSSTATYTFTSGTSYKFVEKFTPKTGAGFDAEGTCDYTYNAAETKGVATYNYTKPKAGKAVFDFTVTDNGNTYTYKTTSVEDSVKEFIGDVGGTFTGKFVK